jgi:hypothetical protein
MIQKIIIKSSVTALMQNRKQAVLLIMPSKTFVCELGLEERFYKKFWTEPMAYFPYTDFYRREKEQIRINAQVYRQKYIF